MTGGRKLEFLKRVRQGMTAAKADDESVAALLYEDVSFASPWAQLTLFFVHWKTDGLYRVWLCQGTIHRGLGPE